MFPGCFFIKWGNASRALCIKWGNAVYQNMLDIRHLLRRAERQSKNALLALRNTAQLLKQVLLLSKVILLQSLPSQNPSTIFYILSRCTVKPHLLHIDCGPIRYSISELIRKVILHPESFLLMGISVRCFAFYREGNSLDYPLGWYSF